MPNPVSSEPKNTPKNMSTQPEYREQEDFLLRSQKLADLRALNIEPYPHKYKPAATADQLQEKYPAGSLGHSDDAAAGTTPTASVAGRLVLFRAMGKNAFAQIQDETGRIQVMFNKDLTHVEGYEPKPGAGEESPSAMKVIEKKFDLGIF